MWALGRLEAWSGMAARRRGGRAAAARERRARTAESPSSTTGSSARRSPARRTRSSSRDGLRCAEHRTLVLSRARRTARAASVCASASSASGRRTSTSPAAWWPTGAVRARAWSSSPERTSAVVLAGDANLRRRADTTAAGFSEPLAGSIDQILVRGLRRRRPSALAGGAAARRRTPPLRSRAGRTDGRMTFDEARAQFPVLERYAYLNAGTNGPLARATVEAVIGRVERDLAGGPQRAGVLRARCSSCATRCGRLRGRARRRSRARRARRLDDARLRDRPRRPRPLRRGRGHHDRPGALRPHRPAARDRARASSSRRPTRTRSSPRSRRARGSSRRRTSSGRPAGGSTSRG